MLDLDTTGQFKRDYKREKAGRHADLDEIFAAVTNLLINKQPLPAANKDHVLRGEWKGCRDCHLKPDLVLIYRKTADAIELVRLRSHAELFG